MILVKLPNNKRRLWRLMSLCKKCTFDFDFLELLRNLRRKRRKRRRRRRRRAKL